MCVQWILEIPWIDDLQELSVGMETPKNEACREMVNIWR